MDKPHGMPVTPSGEHFDGLCSCDFKDAGTAGPQSRTPARPGNRRIASVHRQSANAGAVSCPVCRSARRTRICRGGARRCSVEPDPLANREQAGAWRTVVSATNRGGPTNAITEIELLDFRSGCGRFRLFPKTGKKHQLRVHMASIGCPVAGDPFYPTIKERHEGDLHCS